MCALHSMLLHACARMARYHGNIPRDALASAAPAATAVPALALTSASVQSTVPTSCLTPWVSVADAANNRIQKLFHGHRRHDVFLWISRYRRVGSYQVAFPKPRSLLTLPQRSKRKRRRSGTYAACMPCRRRLPCSLLNL